MLRNTKIGILAVLVVVVILGGFLAMNFLPNDPEDNIEPYVPLEPPEGLHHEGVDIRWLIIEGVKLKYQDTVIYIDPFNIYDRNESILEAADYIIITHDHAPHCSPRDIQALSDENTTLIVARGPSFVPEVGKMWSLLQEILLTMMAFPLNLYHHIISINTIPMVFSFILQAT
ncbi:MAG: MBL fold metallo-hydrolase [Candidatus Thorarchaeota archaeon]|nr:MBL fold metallo-hydrolase [Candidatus Thorarchaeota archaeon]